mmetsp:Transcript_29870/g.69484  ORF Transcript_29870/g.69484 Transcript_29870/m.69484 type:complete len:422 (-) Transcript_29870:146-1411(-)
MDRQTVQMELRERARGCLLGLMVGDAFGAAFEGCSQRHVRETARRRWSKSIVTDFVRAVHMGTYVSLSRDFRGPFRVASDPDEELGFVPPGIDLPDSVLEQCGRSGMYTDDTCSCLAVASSLVSVGKADASHIARSVAELFRDNEAYRGCPPTAKKVMAATLSGVPATSTGLPPYFPYPGGSFANGGAMRISPLAIAYRNAPAPVLREAVVQATLASHRHPEAVDFAVVQAAAVQYALLHDASSFSVAELLDGLATRCEVDAMRKMLVAVKAYVEESGNSADDDYSMLRKLIAKEPRPGSGLDFQIASIHMAPCVLLLVCRHYAEPRQAIAAAVDLGGDTDTTATMVGAIVGALHGDAWCPDLTAQLENGPHGRDYAMKLAEQLCDLDVCEVKDGPISGSVAGKPSDSERRQNRWGLRLIR